MSEIPIRCKYDEMVPTKELKKKINPNNTNKHPKEQIDRLAKLMAYQGVRKPVYINKNTGFIQAGHGRLLAAIKLGLKEYPVERQDYDNDEQALADLTADNAIASWAELDMSMVNEQLEAMTAGFNKELFGLQIFDDNWESDISVIEKIKGNLDGIFSIIKIVCRQQDKEKVKDLISKALKKNPIEGCEIE